MAEQFTTLGVPVNGLSESEIWIDPSQGIVVTYHYSDPATATKVGEDAEKIFGDDVSANLHVPGRVRLTLRYK